MRWIVVGLVASVAVARADGVDIATFEPPAGWTRATPGGAVVFSTVDRAHKTFATVAVLPSVAGTGDPDKDFAAAWHDLVGTPAKPAQGPARSQTKQGLLLLVGAAPTVEQGVPAVTLVTVIVARDRIVRAIAKTNSNDLLVPVDAFVNAIQVGAAAPAASTGNLDEIQFAAPAGWKENRVSGAIQLVDPSGACTLAIAAPQPAGKSLEDDADGVFAMAFGGWKRELEASGPYRKIARGISGDGWEYIKVDSYLSRPAGGADPFAKTEMLGLVFAARIGQQTVYVIGTHAGQNSVTTLGAIGAGTPQCLDEYMSPDWPDFFHSLHFKSFQPRTGELGKHLVGKWWTKSMNSALGYVFAGNGRYERIAGWETFRRIDPATIEVTTTGFTGSGRYKLDGDTLTLVPDKGKPETKRVRWQMTWELGAWSESLYLQEGKIEPMFRKEK